MYNCLYITLIVCSFTLMSCRSDRDTSNQPLATPISGAPIASIERSDPLLPDSIVSYRPIFGNANTIRQFPFSLRNQPDTKLRLMSVLLNGKMIRGYKYNEQGRLVERTDYYANGIQIYRKFAYSYETNTLIGITSQLNKEAPYVEGVPQNSDLLPSTIVTYLSTADSVAWTKKTTVIKFLDWDQKPGTIVSRLGFNSAGASIWEEKYNEQAQLSQYDLFRRNDAGNIVFRRTGLLFNQWEVTHFTYDDKPNPFRTTGDPQTLDLGDLSGVDIANINNITYQSTTNSWGVHDGWRYSYEYRSDGYPNRVIVYRGKEPISTIEFVYNQ